MVVVNILDQNAKKEYEYYLEPRLKKFLDNVVRPSLKDKDKDYVMLVDGYEGSGKSTFSMQIGRYIDSSLNLPNICMTAEEFKNAIVNAKKGQCIIYDEAVTGLSSGDSITKIGRLLKSMMMQMRQKNLFIIIILPTVFELNKYAVLSRARCLFHVYENSGRRGYFVGYNRKDTKNTYLLGKKNYTYRVRTNFKGRFYGKYVIDEEEYRKKKQEALFQIGEEDETVNQKWMKIGYFTIYVLYKRGMPLKEITQLLNNGGHKISYMQVTRIVKKIEEIKEKSQITLNISN